MNEQKFYHAYFSDDKKHDHSIAIDKIIEETKKDCAIIIHSDNCNSQYKSAKHFFGMQRLTDKLNQQVIHVFGVAGHGKGEVDHVGGLSKVAIHCEVAAGNQLCNSKEIVSFLTRKFGDSEYPIYVFREILVEELEVARAEATLLKDAFKNYVKMAANFAILG